MRIKLPTDAQLLDKIRAFCARHHMPPTTFGRNALGDGSLIANLETGRSLTLRKARQVVTYMETYPVSDSKEAA